MKSKDVFKIVLIVIAGILIMYGISIAAENYPTKAIKIINITPPGGLNDLILNGYISAAQKDLGVPIVVDHKPGAGGMVGALAGAKAKPDGYTLTCLTHALVNVLEWEKVNNRKPSIARFDFVPIGSFLQAWPLVIVPYDSSWKTMADLIRDCKAKPNHYSFSSGGLYGASHLPVEGLMANTGIKCRHVPYKGGGPAVMAVVGNHVDFATQFPGPTIKLILGNKLRALAVLGPNRIDS
jgi:tripartite-type tricarboxylate transporter receptor subunit TctC